MMKNVERILCTVDPKLDAEQEKALRYAAALARAFGPRLFVCHCVEDPEVSGNGALRSAGEDLRRLVANLTKGAAPDCETFVVRADDASEAITRAAAERRVDLIVMCSRRRPFRAALIGSNADRVLRQAPCPVLVAHSLKPAFAPLV